MAEDWTQYVNPEDLNPNNPTTIWDFPTALTPEERSLGERIGRIPSSRIVSSATAGNISPTIKKISDIKSKLLSPALTSHYQCWFNPPKLVRDWLKSKELDYNFNAELFSLLCSEASLPGSSLLTNEINDDYTGVTERFAYRRAYDDRADFTFYVDKERGSDSYKVIWFFENWISYISNEMYSDGIEDVNFNYRVQFPENYQSSALYLNKFERDFSDQYLEYRFLQAYPISINSMPVSYESSELLKCTVSFTYTRYVIRRKKIGAQTSTRNTNSPGNPDVSSTPPYYGTGLPGNQANELRRGLLEDLIVRQQNTPGLIVD